MNKFTEGRKEERSSRPDVFCEKDVLRNFAKFKRDSGTGVSSEFCEISKNLFFYRTPLVATSVKILLRPNTCLLLLLIYCVVSAKTTEYQFQTVLRELQNLIKKNLIQNKLVAA